MTSDNVAGTAVCIIGMHRSGTSLASNLLSKCGVGFGPHHQLLQGNHANLLGYFEHQEVAYQVNEKILEHFGGSWKSVPTLPENWQALKELDGIRKTAEAALAELQQSTFWGWKDPRASLLVPFWDSIYDRFKYVICVRNPLDVALSLNKRDGIPLSEGSRLWHQYMSSALEHTDRHNRLIIFYEDFFLAPRQTLADLLSFIGLPLHDKNLAACSTIFNEMRHHQSSLDELLRHSQIDEHCKALYSQVLESESNTSGREASGQNDEQQHYPFLSKRETLFAGAAIGEPADKVHPVNKIHFPRYEQPVASIVIPTFNRANLLVSCLRSVLQYTDIPYQLIIVNDGSSDETKEVLDSLVNVTIVENETNLDFLKSANRGAQKARGKYIVFLNNDVTVRSGWLNSLVETYEKVERCGAVGAKLVSMDGKLQEAGAIILPDGAVELYGAGDNPFKPEYSFMRSTGYCSAACLLIERALFFEIGMFDERYCPAYYEDVDLCMEVWAANRSVVYQPQVVVFHHQMGSRPHSRVLQLCEANKPIFFNKWQNTLAEIGSGKSILEMRQRGTHTNVAIIAGELPDMAALEGDDGVIGSAAALIKSGHSVSFIPTKNAHSPTGVTGIMQQMGIEVFYGSAFNADQHLVERSGHYQLIVICDNCETGYFAPRAENLNVNAQIIDESAFTERKPGELNIE